jgi:hypothetical protein
LGHLRDERRKHRLDREADDEQPGDGDDLVAKQRADADAEKRSDGEVAPQHVGKRTTRPAGHRQP